MVEEGLFSKFPCDEIYALHNWPMIAKGKVAIHRGPVMANENDFRISILGTGRCFHNSFHCSYSYAGGHAAMVISTLINAFELCSAANNRGSNNDRFPCRERYSKPGFSFHKSDESSCH